MSFGRWDAGAGKGEGYRGTGKGFGLENEAKVGQKNALQAAEPPALSGEVSQAAKVKTVERAMSLLGIAPNAKSDPAQVRGILSELKLDDFAPTYAPMRAFLEQVRTQPVSLKPLLDSIRTGLAEKNPAMVEFLALASEKGWLKPGPAVQSGLQTAFVLEVLTVAMANSVEFSEELSAHLMAKRRAYGIDTRSVLSTFERVHQATGGLFEAAKLISIDPLINYMNVIRQNRGETLTPDQFEKVSARDSMTFIDQFALRPNRPTKPTLRPLQINIAEAAATEFSRGQKDNAFVANVLNIDAQRHLGQKYVAGPVLDSISAAGKVPVSVVHAAAAKANGYFPKDSLTDEWARLYETWNAAFVVSQFEDLEVVLPKLLVPSVLNASGDTYLGTRAMALWLALNRLLFRRLDQKEATPPPEHQREMAEAWGRINKKYALELADTDIFCADNDARRAVGRAKLERDFADGNTFGTRLLPLFSEISSFVQGK